MKRAYSTLQFTLKNVPKYWDTKTLKKRLQHDVLNPDVPAEEESVLWSDAFSSIKKVPRKAWARVEFKTQDQRDAIMPQLEKTTWRGQQLSVLETREKIQKERKPSDQPPKPIEHAISPWWDIPYEEQLSKKFETAKSAVQKIPRATLRNSKYNVPSWIPPLLKSKELVCPLEEILPSPVTEGYRNKLQFTVGTLSSTDTTPCVGFRCGRHPDYSVQPPNERCKTVSPLAETHRSIFESFVRHHSKLGVYDTLALSGFYRSLQIRTTEAGDVMASVIIATDSFEEQAVESELQALVEHWTEHGPPTSLLTVTSNVHHNAADPNASIRSLMGPMTIQEKLFDLTFDISHASFFQVNTKGAEVLYQTVMDWAGTGPLLLDVCCGTGTIGQVCSTHFERVLGVDLCEEAIQDANRNAAANGIDHATFVAGAAEKTLPSMLEDLSVSAVAVVDPPRCGLHTKALAALRNCHWISKVIYVACNPNALVSDASHLCRSVSNKMQGAPFRPVRAIAVDMFPHTEHVEMIMEFERVTSPASPQDVPAPAPPKEHE